jgi:hypothetical protein
MATHFKLAAIFFFIQACMCSAQAADYYVSKDGDDTQSGTLDEPFLTISQAASVAQAGDTVFIRSGTYEETLRPNNSGNADNPIVFQSYQQEKVIITAMQALSGWTREGASAIYSTPVDWDLGQNNFVMQDATAMDLARWPNNEDGDPFTSNSLRSSGGSGENVTDGAFIEYTPGIPDFDWTGAAVYFYGDRPGSGWLTWRAFIESSTATQVNFSLADKSPVWIRTAHPPSDGGDFFLMGVKDALDYENEWFFDAENETLYVQLPQDAAPEDGRVKMRRREFTVDLSGRNYIHVKDLAVFGGSIELTSNASNNLISGVSSFYGNFTLGVYRSFAAPSYSINVSEGSTNNVIENSEIAFGAGSGIRDAGTGTTINNNYIHDFNFLGDYNALILARGGIDTTITNNTIKRAGRSGIQLINNNSEVAYNDLSESTLIADDSALFYTVGGPRNIEIHHNWFHNAYSSGSKRKAAGVYLDVDPEGFSVHHNVLWNTEWSGVQINWDGTDLAIHNNTFWNNSETIGAWHQDGTAFSNVDMWNNVSQKSFSDTETDFQNNVTDTQENNLFLDFANNGFQPKKGSAAIDAGRDIGAINDDVLDGMPDAGAYEKGGSNAHWVPGINWEPKLSPTGTGCYGLPGEDCIEIPNSAPSVSFAVNQELEEGDTAILRVTLSDYAAQYPVMVPYTVSGTSDSADHDAINGELTITKGTQANIYVELAEDDIVEDQESLVIVMGTPTNAVKASNNEMHTITVSNVGGTPPVAPSPPPAAPPTPAPQSESGGGSTGPLALLVLFSMLVCRLRQSKI